ncbi:MAG: DNA-cytosine methyltransferase [Candidatus Adlerbacteria bacterium]|nr:DNA-cytosine methyltransferase [Candidatus Adlerbacteria bacterium]
MKNLSAPKVIDLFSGCGGLSFGLEEAGFDIVFAIDNWKDALDTLAYNHKKTKTYVADLGKETAEQICKKIGIKKGDIDVVVGGPPCQGFSISGKRNPNDPRNRLYKSFVDFVSLLKPKVFLMENVPNLVSMQEGKIKDEIIKDFEREGYKVSWKIMDASEYGVPQKRRRVIFIGLKNGEEFVFPKSKKTVTVNAKDAVGDLPEETVPEGHPYPEAPSSDYQKLMRKKTKGIFNHVATVHTEQTKKIINMVPDGANYKSLPKHLHSTRKVNIAWTRLNSKKPSYTMDTGHNHIFHYQFNRVPTARETARIQSFPDTFIFCGGKTSQLKQVGNAVPPLLAKELGRELIKYL